MRIGNGAVKQLQLDAYGQLLELIYLSASRPGVLSEENWQFLIGLVDIVCDQWRKPDQGIWEIRDAPRHFVHSKLNCWLALDRGVKLAHALRLPAPVARWSRERDTIRAYLLREAVPDGWFPPGGRARGP